MTNGCDAFTDLRTIFSDNLISNVVDIDTAVDANSPSSSELSVDSDDGAVSITMNSEMKCVSCTINWQNVNDKNALGESIASAVTSANYFMAIRILFNSDKDGMGSEE